MAETIKNFFNAAVVFNSSATLINNNSTTKALAKTINICNQGAANTFDIKLDGVTIYDDVAIAAKETIKLENENLVVPESKALTIKNNLLTSYPSSLALVIAQNPLYTAVHVTQEGNYFVLFQNDSVSSYPYYAVFSAQGDILKTFTQLVGSAAGTKLRVAETDSYVHIFRPDGAGFVSASVVKKADWTVSNAGSSIHAVAFSYPAICRFVGNNSNYVIMFYTYASTLYLSTTNSGTIFSVPSATAETGGPLSYIRATGLTDGNAIVCYRNGTGLGKMQKWSVGGSPVGTTTQFSVSVVDIFGVVGLSNGTFAIVYRDSGNSNYPTLAIFNDDLTVAVAAFTIRNANTMGMGDNQSNNYLFTDSDNNIYVVFVDTANGNKWKVTSYTYAGVLIDADAKLNTMSTSSEDNVSFAADKEGNLIACYEPASALGQLNIDKLVRISSLNVTVSGVEVTA